MKTKPHTVLRPILFAFLFGLALLPAAFSASAASAAPPELMSYQGYLVDVNGAALAPSSPANYPIVFRIYNASTGGSLLWSEQQIVTVDKGNFSVMLGEGTAVSGEARPALSSAFVGADASDRYLGITVTISGTTMTISPRLRLLPSPYAFYATKAQSVEFGGASIIADGQIEFHGSGAERMRITSSGYVGIGTTSPTTLLQVGQGANAGLGGLKINTGWVNPSDPTEARPFDVQIRGESKLVLNTQGYVGIGTASPRAKLEVDGNIILKGAAGGSSWSNQRLLWGGDGTGWGVSFGSINNSGTINSPVLTMLDNGWVGIGTTTPSAKLHLGGSMKIDGANVIEFGAGVVGRGSNSGKMGYATFSADPMFDIVGANPTGSGTRYTRIHDALYITGWAASPAFHTQSDARIKQITGRPVGETALESLRRLQVTDYRFLDSKLHGQAPRRGLIAQEVEKVLPNAVSRNTEFVPDIYAPAISSQYDSSAKTVTIDLEGPHGLSLGDMVRLNMDNDQKALKVVAAPSSTRFIVEMENQPGQVFVFGKQVNDFRSVDYDHVFATGISAIQELDRQVQALKKSETRVAELEKKVARVESLESQVAELRKLVSQLAATSQNTAARNEAPIVSVGQ